MIKGIIMDIGDVIYDCKLYKKTSPMLMKLKMEQVVLIISMAWIRIYRALFGKIGTRRVIPGSAERTRAQFKLRDGVKDTIDKLHSIGTKIVLLSDSVRSGQTLFDRMVDLGIADSIDGVISSAEIMDYKPHAEAYEKTLQFMGLGKKETVFVGHAKDELLGAQKFGLRTIGYNMDSPVDVNFLAGHFSDIIRIVGEENAKGSDMRS